MTEHADFEFLDRIPVNLFICHVGATCYTPVYLSGDLEKRLGMTAQILSELLWRDPAQLVHPDDAGRLSLMLYKGRVAGGLFSEAVRLRQADGDYSWTDLRLNAVLQSGACQFYFTLIDVEKQKENELRLEHTYEELLGVMNNAPSGIIVFGTKNNREPYPSFVSPGMFRLLRGTKEEISSRYGRDFYAAVHPGDREAVIRAVEEAVRNLVPLQLTMRLRAFDGEYLWVDARGSVEAAEGVRNLYLSFTDSSAERQTRELLQHILDLFVRRQYDNLCIVDVPTGSYRVLSLNSDDSSRIPLEGSDYQAAIGRIIQEFVLPGDRARLTDELRPENLRARLAEQEDAELYFSIRIPQGEVRYKKLWLCWVDRDTGQLALVLSDCTELHQQQLAHQKALTEALQAAEQASLAKSVFLSRISHDIRTPLNAIIGFTKISQEQENSAETGACLGKISQASEYLLSLVNDVLDMSRIESGKFTLKDELFELQPFIDDIHAILAPQCAGKRLECRFTPQPGLRQSYIGDRLKLQQVLVNILGNAVKFTPSGGTITFAAEERAAYEGHAMLRFTVRDTGIGIAPEFLPHLFEAFSQEDTSGQTGAGLGLAICKSIVSLMGGSIQVHSSKGKGSEFRIDVQLGIPKTADLPEYTAPVHSDVSRSRFLGRRILLAEDNAMNQEIARYYLEHAGIAVDTADNGQLALDRFSASAPDCYDAVLLDIRMPVLDGIGAARAIRSLPREDAGSIPIIAMSADAFEEDISKSLSNGINAHLVKPIDRELLYETLAVFWGLEKQSTPRA